MSIRTKNSLILAVDPALVPQPTTTKTKARLEPRKVAVFRAAFDEAIGILSEQTRVMGDGPTITAVQVKHVRAEFKRRC